MITGITVKPGITGLAQIAGKYNTSAYDKLIYDLLLYTGRQRQNRPDDHAADIQSSADKKQY